jgi:hypothetical protein
MAYKNGQIIKDRGRRVTVKINDEVKFAILLIAIIASLAAAFFQPRYPTVKYDCRIAEISPDVPPAVKEQCRQLMQKSVK